jgi:hypothetical protein
LIVRGQLRSRRTGLILAVMSARLWGSASSQSSGKKLAVPVALQRVRRRTREGDSVGIEVRGVGGQLIKAERA